MCGCQNPCQRCSQNNNPRLLLSCAEERTILFSPCRGYYFDDPCCPETYIGNGIAAENTPI